MPAHVASPSRLLRSELTVRRRGLLRTEVPLECEGLVHHVRFDGVRCYAPHHDEAGEAALRALGGVEPRCLRVVRAVETATPSAWWATFDPRARAGPSDDEPALDLLPPSVRRLFLASSLEDEFADAAQVVRDRVAQLGLALLGDGAGPVDALRTRFQLTLEFPHWDPGPGPWSDKELVLLARCMRAAAGEARPHLVLLPSDPLARGAVAKYAVALLDHERFLTPSDLRGALSSTHRNVKALIALLVAEGRLVESAGQYRVRTPAMSGSRRR